MRLFLALGFVVACGGQTIGDLDGGGDASNDATATDAGSTCSASQKCSNGMECGYAESQGCAATTGQCFLGGALCNSFQPGCACDGTTINIACTGLPPGYSTAPLAYDGVCDGGK